jgi:hypothetical protein
MIYLLSSSGRGYIGFLALMGAVLGGLGVGAALGRGEMLCFGLGWIVAGVVCYVLGKRWNRTERIHKFCGLALERWGWIYAGIGVFLTISGYQAMRYGVS